MGIRVRDRDKDRDRRCLWVVIRDSRANMVGSSMEDRDRDSSGGDLLIGLAGQEGGFLRTKFRGYDVMMRVSRFVMNGMQWNGCAFN